MIVMAKNEKEIEDVEDLEEFAEELARRRVSVHGDIRDLDEVIDEVLNKGKDKSKRWFATG